MSDQPVAEAAIYTTHSWHKGRAPVPPAGFEHVIPEIKRPKTYTFERKVTVNGSIAPTPRSSKG